MAQATHLMDLDVRGEASIAGPYGGTPDSSPELRVRARRGTTNRNDRGGSRDRQRRREWLVETYRANVDVIFIGGSQKRSPDLRLCVEVLIGTEGAQPACRCYRCGCLLTAEMVTVDRIKPGCRGGTYRRENIRPACGPCNSQTGGRTRRS